MARFNVSNITLQQVGRACKEFRFGLGYRQIDVAIDLNYSVENISAFEQGRNDSLTIFRWYLMKGFTIDYLIESIERGIENEYENN